MNVHFNARVVSRAFFLLMAMAATLPLPASSQDSPPAAASVRPAEASRSEYTAELNWKISVGDPAKGETTALAAVGDLRLGILTGGAFWWPMCPAIGSDGAIYIGSNDGKLYAILPHGEISWTYQTGGEINSSPALGKDGTIYFGSKDNNIYALNQDGTLKWSYATGDLVLSSPAIGADSTIFVGSNDHKLYALNPDGSLKWSFTTGDAVIASPAVSRFGTIYVGSADGYFYAIGPDGQIRWRYQTGDGIVSSACINSDGTVYVGSYDHFAYAFDPVGRLKWKIDLGDMIVASPVIGLDGSIYLGSFSGIVNSINPNGEINWQVNIGDKVWSSPAVGLDGTLYIGGVQLYAITPLGKIKWRYRATDFIMSSPAIGEDGTIYFGAQDYIFYAIESGINGGLGFSYWPKFNGNAQNNSQQYLGHIGFVVDNILATYSSIFTSISPIKADSVALSGDGSGYITETPKYLEPSLTIKFILQTLENVTPPLTFDCKVTGMGPHGALAGNRVVELRDGFDNLIDVPQDIMVNGRGTAWNKDLIWSGEINNGDISYLVNMSIEQNLIRQYHTQLDLGGYNGSNVGFVIYQFGESKGDFLSVTGGLSTTSYSRAGEFKITWISSGGELTCNVQDLTHGISIPYSPYIDDNNWGFIANGNTYEQMLRDAGNTQGGPNNVLVPKEERSLALVETLPENNTTDFYLYVNGQAWHFGNISNMPSNGSEMTVIAAYGYWNGDMTIFTQIPPSIFVGDAWRIDIPSQTFEPRQPPPPIGQVTLTCDTVMVSPGDSFDLLVSLDNSGDAVGGGQFVVSTDSSHLLTFVGGSVSERLAGWEVSMADSTGSQMVVFYSSSNAILAPGTGTILKLTYTLDAGINSSEVLPVAISSVTVGDEFNRALNSSSLNSAILVTLENQINGTVNFLPSQVPVPGVVIEVTSDIPGYQKQVISLDDGSWTMSYSPLYSGHTYTLTPYKPGLETEGISPLDAAYVLMSLFDPSIFQDSIQYQLADVSGDGEVAVDDVIQILRYCLGDPLEGLTGTWQFNPSQIVKSYTEMPDILELNIDALLIGDVTASYGGGVYYQPGGSTLASADQILTNPIIINTNVSNDTLALLITATGANFAVLSLALELEIVDNNIQFLGNGPSNSNAQLISRSSQNGRFIRSVVVSANGLQFGGEPFTLLFRVTGEIANFDDISELVVIRVCDVNDISLSETLIDALSASMKKIVLPKAYNLSQNYPNPFNPTTTINYSIPEYAGPVQVSIKIYNIRGQLVSSLVNMRKDPGKYSLQWDGKDNNGRSVNSGVFFYKIIAGKFKKTRKMILLK